MEQQGWKLPLFKLKILLHFLRLFKTEFPGLQEWTTLVLPGNLDSFLCVRLFVHHAGDLIEVEVELGKPRKLEHGSLRSLRTSGKCCSGRCERRGGLLRYLWDLWALWYPGRTLLGYRNFSAVTYPLQADSPKLESETIGDFFIPFRVRIHLTSNKTTKLISDSCVAILKDRRFQKTRSDWKQSASSNNGRVLKWYEDSHITMYLSMRFSYCFKLVILFPSLSLHQSQVSIWSGTGPGFFFLLNALLTYHRCFRLNQSLRSSRSRKATSSSAQ